VRWTTTKAFVLTLGVFGGGLYAGASVIGASYAAGASPYASLDTFARAISHIERHYVEAFEPSELVYRSLDGLADSLDDHTLFLDPDAYRQLLEDSAGAYSGIGVEVRPHARGGLEIVDVVPGGPAAVAGVQVADRIVAVDGEDVVALPFRDAVERVRGPRGQPVLLEIDREDAPARLELSVVRDEVHTLAARGELVEPGLGYVRLEQFRRHAGEEFEAALAQLQEETPLSGLVLDLRDNPGGLLEEAVTVVDALIAEGTIVTTEGRSAGASETHAATAASSDLLDARVVVLVDGTSASAAEIVAGALQDHGRATILGQPTYGKGSVQSVFEYQDRSALRLTVARYHLPSGRSIEEDGGVVPDVVQSLAAPASDAAARLRARLQDLEGIDEPQRQELLHLLQSLEVAPSAEAGPPRFSGPALDRAETDLQLRAALALARGETR